MIERALTRRGSAASKPSTIMRAYVLARAGIRRRRRKASKEASLSSSAPFTARCASANAFMRRRRPPTRSRCSRDESTAARPARLSSACVTFASPWMNSAPSSSGTSRPGTRRVQQRPPTRSRASSTSTRSPARASSSAAARPAAPAPMTMTSQFGVRAAIIGQLPLVADEAPGLHVEIRAPARIAPDDLQRRRVDLRRLAKQRAHLRLRDAHPQAIPAGTIGGRRWRRGDGLLALESLDALLQRLALKRVTQASRQAFRIAATGGRRGADAVRAEVAQAAGLVVDLRNQGDEIQIAVEKVFVGERPRVALRLLRAARAAVGGLAVRGDHLMHVEGGAQVERSGLLLVGVRAAVLPVLRRQLPRAGGELAGDAVAGLVGALGGDDVADRILVLLVAIADIERSASPFERAAVQLRIRARGSARHRRRVALALVAGHGRPGLEAAEARRPVLEDVIRPVVESELAHHGAGHGGDGQIAEWVDRQHLRDLERRVPAAEEHVAEGAGQADAAIARGEVVGAAGGVVGFEAGLELTPALQSAAELLLGAHAEQR